MENPFRSGSSSGGRSSSGDRDPAKRAAATRAFHATDAKLRRKAADLHQRIRDAEKSDDPNAVKKIAGLKEQLRGITDLRYDARIAQSRDILPSAFASEKATAAATKTARESTEAKRAATTALILAKAKSVAAGTTPADLDRQQKQQQLDQSIEESKANIAKGEHATALGIATLAQKTSEADKGRQFTRQKAVEILQEKNDDIASILRSIEGRKMDPVQVGELLTTFKNNLTAINTHRATLEKQLKTPDPPGEKVAAAPTGLEATAPAVGVGGISVGGTEVPTDRKPTWTGRPDQMPTAPVDPLVTRTAEHGATVDTNAAAAAVGPNAGAAVDPNAGQLGLMDTSQAYGPSIESGVFPPAVPQGPFPSNPYGTGPSQAPASNVFQPGPPVIATWDQWSSLSPGTVYYKQGSNQLMSKR